MRQNIQFLNAVRAAAVPAKTPSVCELSAYRARPGAARQWLDLFTRALEVRKKYSTIVGLRTTEASLPNDICYLSHPDLNARASIHAEVAKDSGWQELLKSSGGMLDEMHSTILLSSAHSCH